MLSAMTVRPFPSAARARSQVMRHYGNQIPAHLLPTRRDPQGQPGVYVLSTRRPGTVSGPS
ncbi:hypothetical protein GCM10010095_82850 [Streptomyces anthocyanicus]|uniref:Uncharacterized protein n=1 Tax=Streptomyces violaceolatus TaxID=67378 RepID=A0ABN3TIA1_9ACTN|nr:hypothetical protein GCM10010095_82850 [Streptomyces anthocyanicus]GHC33337.1 hypothetical protein GCM10010348_70390 [Streptomyces anthocyanicus]